MKSGIYPFLRYSRFFILFLLVFPGLNGLAQVRSYDLVKLLSQGLIEGDNRTVSALNKSAVRLSEADGYGVAWLKGVQFSEGTIEIDLRGKDVKQGSFLGVAFHGTTKDTCEAIYFRPFNFLSADSAQRSHMVQYVFENKYGWERLRNEFPGIYEGQVSPAINPAEWFHVRIELKGEMIKVYTNKSDQPCLTVKSLNAVRKGRLGLWVGNNSPGDFDHLIVRSN
ncbi:hypothetical protein OQY15_04385 [Pedobacter sp. MC2016-15]|uniref:hypothetical protein n=1 Tax=Pedobacter sp. MC2016-15 TaxID=2994473 RepID=UPI002246A32B|nr:hypothetical protein [Pedobacter sp. MC2016-15]MCX2478314.1 hypothetical protein [Pedobacter sp. MC2016-15]